MKKFIALLSLVISLSAGFIALPVYGIDPLGSACENAQGTQFCDDKPTESMRTLVDTNDSLLIRIARTVIFITGAVSVIMIIIGGFKYVISNGDSNAVQSAKNTILYAVVGLVVAVSAQIIVMFVLSSFN